nr:MAG TPA: hypothetical protein [Caudoviricetes sp.]
MKIKNVKLPIKFYIRLIEIAIITSVTVISIINLI